MKLKNTLSIIALAPVLVGASLNNADAFSCADDPFCAMQARMNMLMNSSWNDPLPWGSYSSYSRTELKDQDKNMVVRVDIPGVDKKDIDVNLSEYTLTIAGKRKYDDKDKTPNYAEFKRIIQLPARADVDNTKTKYENGVLEITIPKLEPEKSKSKKLSI